MSKRKKYACSGISAFACSVGINVSHVFNSKLYLREKKYACSGIMLLPVLFIIKLMKQCHAFCNEKPN